MRDIFVKRIETLLQGLSALHNRSLERAGMVTCTRQRRLRSTGMPPIVSDNQSSNAPLEQNDCGRTVLDKCKTQSNMTALEGTSIYFWRPNYNWCSNSSEKRISRFAKERSKERTKTEHQIIITNRNKESFVQFREPALLAMAENSQTPANTLSWLAAHQNRKIRQSVARNKNTAKHTLWLLAKDDEEEVRAAVLENQTISKELSAKLASDKSYLVSTKASDLYTKIDTQAKQAPLPESDSSTDNQPVIQKEIDFLKAVAISAPDSQRLFVQPPSNAETNIHMLVAGDPSATAEILWQLAKHPVSQLKKKSVNKYNCLLETIVSLRENNQGNRETNLCASANQTLDHIVPPMLGV